MEGNVRPSHNSGLAYLQCFYITYADVRSVTVWLISYWIKKVLYIKGMICRSGEILSGGFLGRVVYWLCLYSLKLLCVVKAPLDRMW